MQLKSATIPWALRHAAYIYNRFQVLKTRKTPFEQVKMTRLNATMLEFGECVLAKKPQPTSATLDPLWSEGVWLGRSTLAGDHLFRIPTGVIQARAVKPLDPANDGTRCCSTRWCGRHGSPTRRDRQLLKGLTGHRPRAARLARRRQSRSGDEGGPRGAGHTPACLQRRAKRRMAGVMRAAPAALLPASTEPMQAPQQRQEAAEGEHRQDDGSAAHGQHSHIGIDSRRRA